MESGKLNPKPSVRIANGSPAIGVQGPGPENQNID
jgi:hypothetical protein